MYWLKTTHVYYPIVLEARSQEWVTKIVFLLEALGKNPFPCPSQLPEASCTPWLVVLHHSYLRVCHHISSLALTLLPPSFTQCPVTTLGQPGSLSQDS